MSDETAMETMKMNRRQFLKTLSLGSLAVPVTGILTGYPAGSARAAMEKTRLAVGWSEEGSAGFAVGQVLAKIMHQYSDSVETDVRSTGSAENIRLLSRNKLDFGYTNAHLYDLAMRDEPPFADHPVQNKPWQAFGIFGAQMFYLARKDSGVKTISDFAGKRVTIYTPSVSMYSAAKHGLQRVGVYDKMQERQISISDVPQAFENGRVDVTLCYNAARTLLSGWAQELVSRMNDDDYIVVEPTEEEAQAMAVGGVTIDRAKPVKIFKEKEAPTISRFSLGYNQFVRPDVKDEYVYEFVRTIHQHRDQAANESALLRPFGKKPSFFDSLLTEYSVHPGAARYYKEQGWWTDQHHTGMM